MSRITSTESNQEKSSGLSELNLYVFESRMRREWKVLMGFIAFSWGLFLTKVGGEGLFGLWPKDQVVFDDIGLLLEGLSAFPVCFERPSDGRSRKKQSASRRQSNYPRAASMDLNLVDSAQLERLPRLGPVLSARICKFREALGGYHSAHQLNEIWGMKPEVANEIIPWFHVGDGVFRFLCADSSSWADLRAHPYIQSSGARAIERFRRYHVLDSVNALLDAIPITDSLIRRWSPYLRVCEPSASSPR